jgi:NAD(P)-dependent dehydrogenase (short-subunit alcohol dehydrogenase family)
MVADGFQDEGYRVIGIDAEAQSIEARHGYGADLTSESEVAHVMDRVYEEHGPPDVLIHTVGMWSGQPTEDVTLESWQRIVDVNLTSTFLVFREILQRLPQSGHKRTTRLIGFASGQGADRGAPEQAAYSAAKAGVIRLVESVAAEYRDRAVLAYAIAPSMILFDDMQEERGIPARDLVNLCIVLSSEAGAPMSGTTLRAYGTLV